MAAAGNQHALICMFCIYANEGRHLRSSKEASQTQPDPVEFSDPFWLRQLLQHLGRGHKEPSLQIRDGAGFLGEFGSAGFTLRPFLG